MSFEVGKVSGSQGAEDLRQQHAEGRGAGRVGPQWEESRPCSLRGEAAREAGVPESDLAAWTTASPRNRHGNPLVAAHLENEAPG